MLQYGRGNNDLMAATATIISGGTATDPRVSVIQQIENMNLITVVLATTDAAGVYNGATGSGVVGSWKFELSNNYRSATENIAGQKTDALNPVGVFVDHAGAVVQVIAHVGTLFLPIVKGATDPTLGIPNPSGTGGSAFGITFANVGYRHLRITFTPSANQAALQRAAAFMVGKDYK
jgi:hypothetical protein